MMLHFMRATSGLVQHMKCSKLVQHMKCSKLVAHMKCSIIEPRWWPPAGTVTPLPPAPPAQVCLSSNSLLIRAKKASENQRDALVSTDVLALCTEVYSPSP